MFEDDIQRGLTVVWRCTTYGFSYHSGMNELFSRHTDTNMKLTVNAPTRVALLFDGLTWRPRLNHVGLWRANYTSISPLSWF